jgi:hypothetical protein
MKTSDKTHKHNKDNEYNFEKEIFQAHNVKKQFFSD